MISRFVKLTFDPSRTDEFITIFEASKHKIRNFEGCLHLELLFQSPNVFFTYSKWENEEALERYRVSDLFKETWAKTKVLFCEKPEAWSLITTAYVEKN